MYPQYDEDGSELYSFQNIWRDTQPQVISGAECFVPEAIVDNDLNKIVLQLSGIEFRKMFSALYNGAELTYPNEYLQIIVNFLKGLHCTPDMEDESGCINYPPSASFIEYIPQNPFNEPDLVPEDYLIPPFVRNTDLEYPALMGYQQSDVMVRLDAIPVFSDWLEVLGLSWPTIKLNVTGTGQIEIDFLSIVLGGQVVVKVGSPPNILDLIDGIVETGVKIIDLGQDVTAIPPESDIIISEEINVDAPTGTSVYLVFLPKIDISTEFFGFGGGIRQIGLCGLESSVGTMGIEDIRYDFVGGTGKIQARIDGVWTDKIDVYNMVDDAVNPVQSVNFYNNGENTIILQQETTGGGGFIDVAAVDLSHFAEDFEIGLLSDAIDFAQETADGAVLDAEFAQETADGAVTVNNTQNTRLDNLETEVSALDARLDLLESQKLWTLYYDFTTSQHGFGHDSGSEWNLGTGFEGDNHVMILHGDTRFKDGRIAYYRLDFYKVGTGEAFYTTGIFGQVKSHGVAESGLNSHYHKLPNIDTDADFELELDGSGVTWQIRGLAIFGYGTSDAWDD